jgi:hypothetical protein
MKTSTIIIIAGVGLLGVYVLTRKSTPLPASSVGSTSLIGAAGQFLGGILSGAGTLHAPSSPGAVTASSGSGIMAPAASSGDSEVAIVKSLDAGGISSYDSQGTSDAPVYGIAGLDY